MELFSIRIQRTFQLVSTNKKRQFGYINLQKQEKAHRYHIDMPSETMTAKRNN